MARELRSKKKFLSGYELEERILIPGDTASGRPEVSGATAPDGSPVLVKFWKRQGSPNPDIEDIWRSEIRQLQRLAAVPRADDLFVRMFAQGEDDDGFYIVVDPVQGAPLEMFQKAKNQPDAIAHPRLPRNRRLIWANALRIAQAMDLLHSQGIIHRNIDPWAVVTSFSDKPDFRLTGFEWSMRMANVDGASAGKQMRRGNEQIASFRQDWIKFGLLLSQLLSAPAERIADLRILPSEIADYMTAAEGRLLRTIFGIDDTDRLDGGLICRRIEEVIEGIEAQVANKELRLVLSVRLGQASDLSASIRRASGNEIALTDLDAQRRFVTDDLSEEPFLANIMEQSRQERPVLLGRHLAYSLQQFRLPHSTEPANWEFAACERAKVGRPFAIGEHRLIEPAILDVVESRDAVKSFPRRRSRVARWDELLASLEPRERAKTDFERKHQAFALLSVLEMAYAAADIFPVDVRPGSADVSSGVHALVLSPRHDGERAALSKALKLQAPAVRLSKMLENDELPDDEGWSLAEGGSLGERNRDSEWRFLESSQEGASQVLKFEGGLATRVRGSAFLSPAGMNGQIAQFRRRVKALKALREHTELLQMFVDPRARIEDSRDPVVKDQKFDQLDGSKQLALDEILSTVPLFLLQGPPGVGKTFMVGDLVRRRFEDEPTTRLLLSAQSNAAIDHLMKEVQTVFPSGSEPVMVRARPADDDPADTDLEIDRQADRLLETLAKSELVNAASPHVKSKILALAESRRDRNRRDGAAPRMSAEARAFEAMILRAANVVFATTNSAAVEQLIEERGLFDWTIVEEAGKATGAELLSPLLLSHRRLMIGDHKQLPPYGADRMSRLLADPSAVKEAVRASQAVIARHLKDPGMEEIFEEVESDETDYARLCGDALETLTLFETLVEGELRWQKGHLTARPIARRLNEQHRMHPAIAKIVSDCFYESALNTNEKKVEEYRNGRAPFRSTDSAKLPETPIVFVDMPYVREKHGYKGGDRAPAWSNADEVTAVLQVLSLLEPQLDSKAPTLAVLSPYREQVKRLRRGIESRLVDQLSNIRGFQPAVGGEEFCGTVDSFQGDQADLVIVSMVRNNWHGIPAKALGFLRDDRRMNVLLSRAKWRMIVIGSLHFYENVVTQAKSLPDNADAAIGFLERFITALRQAEDAGDASVVEWDALPRIGK